MFMGEYAHNIDRKGRLIMPAKFRDELGEHVVVNRGLDGCLYVYTVEQWQQVYQKLSTLPSTNKDARMYQRMMLSKAAECEMDSQGRILIPSSLICSISIDSFNNTLICSIVDYPIISERCSAASSNDALCSSSSACQRSLAQISK